MKRKFLFAAAFCALLIARDYMRQQNIDNALNYLKGTKFSCNIDYLDKEQGRLSMKWEKSFAYEFVEYSKDKNILHIRQEKSTNAYSVQSPDAGSARSTLEDIKIDLSKSYPVVNIEDYNPSNSYDHKALLKSVSFKGYVSSRFIHKEDFSIYDAHPDLVPTKRFLTVFLRDDDKSKLTSLPWKDWEERICLFVVSKDTAPKLKDALLKLIELQ